MKKWIQKTAGLILSAFLALGISSRAHAAEEEESVQPPEIQFSQTAPVEEISDMPSANSSSEDAENDETASAAGIGVNDSAAAEQNNNSNMDPDENTDTDETASYVGIKANSSAPDVQDNPAGSDPFVDTDSSEISSVAGIVVDESASNNQDGSSVPDPVAGEYDTKPASDPGISIDGFNPNDQNGPSVPDPASEEYNAGTASTENIGSDESSSNEQGNPSNPDPTGETGSAVSVFTGEPSSSQDDCTSENVFVSLFGSGSSQDSSNFIVASAPPDTQADDSSDPQEGNESSSPLLTTGGETLPTEITIDNQEVTAQGGWTYNEETGQIALVNYDHSNSSIVSTGPGGLVIAASGYNRLESITSEGDVNVIGTGLLLLDSVVLGPDSGFYLQTPVDIYEDGTGSVAVFIKTGPNEYTLVNGSSVPGILDEEYTITGVNLIIPSGSSLFLNSGGTVYDKNTGEILFRFADNEGSTLLHEYGVLSNPEDLYFAGNDQYGVDETNGSLTIGAGASLTVNGTIRMEKTTSIITWDSNPVPLLSASDGGSIVLNGAITGDGRVEMEEGSSLSGSGSAQAYRMQFDEPEILSDCNVSLHADNEICIFGNGTIPNLILDDTIVLFGYENDASVMTVSNLVNHGNSALVNYNHLTLESVENSGTLTLVSDTEYPSSGSVFDLNGTVKGGTLRLAGGVFHLGKQFALEEDADVHGEHVIVYDDFDYFGSSGSFTAPLIVSPEQVTLPVLSGNSYSVPLVIVQAECGWVFGRRGMFITDLQESTIYFKNVDGEYVADFGDASSYEGGENLLANLLTEVLNSSGPRLYLTIEIQDLDEDGNLSFRTESYNPYDLDLETETLLFELQNAYLVRITISDFWPLPAGSFSSTSTIFTGAGILGNGGAGSLSGGSGNQINFGSGYSDPDPDPDNPVTPSTTGDSAGDTSLWRVVVTESSDYHRVTCYYGAQEVIDPGRKVTAKMNFVLPSGWDGQSIYAVFRNADGTLTAFKAEYTASNGMLRFDTDLTGIFALVSFPFGEEPLSKDFYVALEELEIIRNLPIRR